ncbi:MAG: response regulator, partial [Oscillospiraceae bacterium]
MIEKRKVKVLIVDDSPLFRTTLEKFISEDQHIEVIGKAGDAYEARDMILELHPDVMTLDVEMPKMNGIDFLKRLMPQYPLPVVVVSSMAMTTFDALEAGAVDYVKKPLLKTSADMQGFFMELRTKIIIASTARIITRSAVKTPTAVESLSEIAGRKHADTIIALGAST